MITDYVDERFERLYDPVYDGFVDNPEIKSFKTVQDTNTRDIDKNDPRNFLLNLLDFVHKNLSTFTTPLLGLQITKVYSTVNNRARVTYTAAFTFKETRSNVLLDEPQLEAIIPF